MNLNVAFVVASAFFVMTLLLIVWLWPRLERERGGEARLFVLALIGFLSLIHQYVLRVRAEDAYITFRYSRNLALGQGPVFNPGERVEGYSDFLWMLLLAACHRWAGLDIPTVARILGAVAALLTLWVVYRLASGVERHDGGDPRPGLVAALLVASSSSFAAWAWSGMETSLFVLFCVGILAAALRDAWKCTGFLIGASTMTRPEGIVLVGPLVVWMLCDARPVRERVRAVAVVLTAFAVAVVPWTVWRIAYYGDWIPNAMRAKLGMMPLFQVKLGLVYVVAFGIAHGVLLVLAAVVLGRAGAMRAWVARTGPRRTLWLVGGFVAGFTLFVAAAGGDWMPAWRLLVPIVPGIAVILAILWSESSPSGELLLGSRAAIALVAVVSFVLYGTSWSHAQVLPYVRMWGDMSDGLEEIGEWFQRSLPKDTLIATLPNGALSYYSGLPVIDMMGLTDRHIAVAGLRWAHGSPGHVAYDYAYVARREPKLVFPAGQGFEKWPTSRYLREEFRSEYRAVCFRFGNGTNPLGQYVNVLLLDREREQIIGLLEKGGPAEVVPCSI